MLVYSARANLNIVRSAPDPRNEICARDRFSATRSEQLQNLELPLREGNGPPFLPCLARAKVHDNVSGLEPIRRSGIGCAAEKDCNPGHQLHNTEGLGDVVVGPELEAAHLVHLLPPRSQHEYQDPAGVRAQLLEKIKSG